MLTVLFHRKIEPAGRLLHGAALALAMAWISAGTACGEEGRQEQRDLAALGRRVFADAGLSEPRGVSCLSCHAPAQAFADPRPVSLGATGAKGRRNAPSLMYAALIPHFEQEDILLDNGDQIWVWQGGLFQDGSARTLHEQVKRPFLDPAEMNLGSEAELAKRLRKAEYAGELKRLAGKRGWENDAKVAETAYRSLVEFLKEPEFRPFDARIDDFLKGDSGALTEAEKRGLEVFRGKGKCADCHLLHASVWTEPLLSDYGYDNLGVPSRGEPDPGLGGHRSNPEELGQFRAPTLRNIALTAPYFHNGSVGTLREVLEFYNRRDLEPERWGATDYPETVNREDLGNLELDEKELEDLLALMEAFTDRTLLRMKEEGRNFPAAKAGAPASWKMRAYFPDWNYRLEPLPAHPTGQPVKGAAE